MEESVTKTELMHSASLFAGQGYLCSEAVLLAVKAWWGVQDELIPRIATGFGAGVGRQGSICGALSGGIMALGIQYGRDKPTTTNTPYWFAQELIRRFSARFGTVTCRELTGCDLATEAGQLKYEEEQIWTTKCHQYVEEVAGFVYDIVSENSPSKHL
ncbi:MAG: C_GCAxxG_C_C family protein [Candidatus Bathyarchaeota archaeon]|nr:MAG: C_GCAxxG_C_C family protein [Candidatus Bathyarchaeota archaeon]